MASRRTVRWFFRKRWRLTWAGFRKSRWPKLISRFKSQITEHGFFSPGEHVLVGVSGGADSVCLLVLLRDLAPSLGIGLTIAHLNHGIRKSGAAEDEDFVRGLAARLELPLIRGRANVPVRARNAGISLEMAAREARYSFFARSAAQAGASAVATAHTADDQAETMLLRLTRGAGAAGLAGIARETVIRGVRVVRPLLDVTHRQACAFLRSRGIAWREDETNRDTAFQRNLLRHEILPLLEEKLNPGVRENIARTADILGAEDAWLTELCREILAKCRAAEAATLSVSRLREQHQAARRRVLILWLTEVGVPTARMDFDLIARVDSLLRKRSGRRAQIEDGICILRAHDCLKCVGRDIDETLPDKRIELPVPGEIVLAQADLRVRTRLAPGIEKPTGLVAGTIPARATISKKAVGRKKLYVRFWRPGDRMSPPGMRGSRKLQDIFTDAKVPRDRRRGIPLIECGGRIVWLPGYRVARGWEVGPAESAAIRISVHICKQPSWLP